MSHIPCTHCSKTYEPFKTAHGKVSKLCPQCRETQQRADEKRKDRVRNYQAEAKRNLDTAWSTFLKKSVERREKENSLTKEEFLQYIQTPCYYCNYYDENEINGIDRIDNLKGYSKENCVTACKTCNRMKHIFHPVFFIEKAKLIMKFADKILTDSERDAFYLKWKEYVHKSPVPYIYIKRSTEEKRGIPYQITKEEYEEIIYKPCYLCGFKCRAGNGLDRVNNTKREYSYDNVQACCSSCNMMKALFTKEEFLQKIKEISAFRIEYPIEWLTIPRNGFQMGRAKTEDLADAEKEKQWRAKTIYKAIRSGTTADFIEYVKQAGLEEKWKLVETDAGEKTFQDMEVSLKKLVAEIRYKRNGR
jgi:predicted  nucleic acid-binding Zn-ribbon protein